MSPSEPAAAAAEPTPARPLPADAPSSGDEPHAAPTGGLSSDPGTAPPDRGEPALRGSAPRRARLAFRRWRRTRPFWGGLLILLGGGEILFSEKAPFKVILHIGLQGLAGYLLPAVMVLCGVLLWFTPAQRTFYGILSVLLALGTWLTSNLGGFLIGMLLGLIGGSLAFGWSPRLPAAAARPDGEGAATGS